MFQDNAIEGDESRYLYFAHNLINGFYSPPPPNINLWNGPGYPIMLIPFVSLKTPLVYIVLFNGLLNYLSIILLFKALRLIVSTRVAFIFSFFWGCYYAAFEDMLRIYTESFTSFLVSLLVFLLVKSFSKGAKGTKLDLILAGITLGYLVLTKVIFGYILLIILVGVIGIWVFNKKSSNYRRLATIVLIAFVTILPYLLYTYHITNKLIYFGNSGSMSLYWMSTPNENEYGDWFGKLTLAEDQGVQNIHSFEDSLRVHHQRDYQEIYSYVGIERDNAFKRLAIKNIRSHPLKYLENCFSNFGRMLFSYPFSYSRQDGRLKLPFNAILLVCMLFSIILTIKNWVRVTFQIRFMFVFLFLYLSLSTLVSAYDRMFTVMVPLILCWIAYVFQKSLTIQLKFRNETDLHP
jgi:hypothetical protein